MSFLEENQKLVGVAALILGFSATLIFTGGNYIPKTYDNFSAQSSGVLPQERLQTPSSIEDLPPAPQKKQWERDPVVSSVNSPNLLRMNGKLYFLFNTNVLLPLSPSVWKEYEVETQPGSAPTSEFYSEPRDEWTQKFVMHGPIHGDEDCTAFVEKLITGVIVSLDDQMRANGHKLEKENLLFSFVKKSPTNTTLFWHRKDIPKMEDEVQFMRCFTTPEKKMYLATLTLRTSPDELSDRDISQFIRTLEQIVELKEKEPQKKE